MTWVVVFQPTMDQVCEAVGPFRSQTRAMRVRDRLDKVLADSDVEAAPQLVMLDDLAEVIARWAPDQAQRRVDHRAAINRCTIGARHWFTYYGRVGSSAPACLRCDEPNPNYRPEDDDLLQARGA
jgi:hypothetical protein